VQSTFLPSTKKPYVYQNIQARDSGAQVDCESNRLRKFTFNNEMLVSHVTRAGLVYMYRSLFDSYSSLLTASAEFDNGQG
jgi:hypothetical protein